MRDDVSFIMSMLASSMPPISRDVILAIIIRINRVSIFSETGESLNSYKQCNTG